MEIDYIGAKNNEMTGVSKYQNEIHKRLKKVKINKIEYTPGSFIIKNINLSNIFKLYLIYPLMVKFKVKNLNIKHINPQSYAYLLEFINLKNTIVTCHDLIPWIYDNNRSIPWKLNINGLKKADRIITVSNFSKNEIIKYLDYPEDKIHVIYNAVNHDQYFKNRDKSILNKLGINKDFNIILYVGSEQPRQNVPILLKAFAKVKKRIPDIKLIKIGRPQYYGARKEILKLINDLNIDDDVIFIDYVAEQELPKWYNASEVLVYPCEYAGFGLPPLEAMACGTPVITSNLTSLPEVVGDAGILINPKDHELMADMIFKVLTDTDYKKELIEKGIDRSKSFNWEDSAKKTQEIYDLFI